MIRQNKGAVTAEQLAPYCDEAPDPAEVEKTGYVDEVRISFCTGFHFGPQGILLTITQSFCTQSYVLPVVTALGGEPRVTDDGDIVYVFPELLTSASSISNLPVGRSSEDMVLKRAGLSSRASAGEIKRILEFNGISTRGALERGELIRILEEALPPPKEDERNEMDLSDPSLLTEREWKFSLATDLNKILAGGLGVVNFGGALYLGNLLNQYALMGVRLPAYFGTVQALYPLLLGYAVLFNVIPFARNLWIQKQNEQIRQRNKIRSSWKSALLSSYRDSGLQKKIAAAQKMGGKVKQLGSSSDEIVYDTSSPMEENQLKKVKSDLDEFDKLLGDSDTFQ